MAVTPQGSATGHRFYSEDDPRDARAAHTRGRSGPVLPTLVGNQAADSYRPALEEIGALLPGEIEGRQRTLERIARSR